MIRLMLLHWLFLGKVANSAVDARTAHTARTIGAKINQVVRQPHGHYSHDTLMVGTVDAIHPSPNPSVDIYPNGAQVLGETALIPMVQYFPPYVPTIGDVVVVITQPVGKSRSLRFVLGKIAGAASPYPTPLGGEDSSGRYVYDLLNMWAAAAVPPSTLGANNDWCLSQNGHMYFKSAGAWALVI